jgi:hypothetical protein
VASLARKRMAATAFFRDGEGRVLLVNPVYKQTWDLPGGCGGGGGVAARCRDVAEQLGLDRRPGLRCLDAPAPAAGVVLPVVGVSSTAGEVGSFAGPGLAGPGLAAGLGWWWSVAAEDGFAVGAGGAGGSVG